MRKALMPSIWLIVGAVIGALTMLFWIHGLEPNWVEAAGTWFGGVATVLTLLWAVRVFRSDQRHREEERQRRHLESLTAEQLREEERVRTASAVSFALRGGAGHGVRANTQMTSLHIDIVNASDNGLSIIDVIPDDPLEFAPALKLPIQLPANQSETISQMIVPIAVPKGQFSGRPFTEYGALFVYMISGQTWARRPGSRPYPYHHSE